MRVRFVRDWNFNTPGKEVDVNESIAESLVKRGMVVPAEGDAPVAIRIVKAAEGRKAGELIEVGAGEASDLIGRGLAIDLGRPVPPSLRGNIPRESKTRAPATRKATA